MFEFFRPLLNLSTLENAEIKTDLCKANAEPWQCSRGRPENQALGPQPEDQHPRSQHSDHRTCINSHSRMSFFPPGRQTWRDPLAEPSEEAAHLSGDLDRVCRANTALTSEPHTSSSEWDFDCQHPEDLRSARVTGCFSNRWLFPTCEHSVTAQNHPYPVLK